MLSTANPMTSFPSLLAPTGVFGGFALNAPQESRPNAAGLGVSTAAAPLISAPATRQASGFQASIAPPTRPTNPAIAPPSGGNEGKSLSGTGASIQSPTAKLAYISAIKLEMAAAQSNGPSGDKQSVLAMAGVKGK